MDKKNMIYRYKRLCPGGTLKEEGSSGTHGNKADLEDIMLSEVSQSQRDRYCGIALPRGYSE